jgi:hypothetical protein
MVDFLLTVVSDAGVLFLVSTLAAAGLLFTQLYMVWP